MLKLAKYLRPFLFGLVLAIGLLFAQAMFDLNLPNLMSEMVNVGIQQGGIAHTAPEAISQEAMGLIQTLMTPQERETVSGAYTLVSVSDANGQGNAYRQHYPNATGDIYVKNAVDGDTSVRLFETFARASSVLVTVWQEGIGAAQSQAPATPDNQTAINLAQIYALQPAFAQLPEQTLTEARAKAGENSMLLSQTGNQFTKAFYAELGADIPAMQRTYIMKMGLLMLLVALGSGVATILVSYISTKIATGVARNLRKDVFDKVVSFSNKEFDQFSTASLITRCTNDVTQVQMLLTMGIRMVCYAPIMGIGGIFMAISKSPAMSWIIAVAVIALMGLVLGIMSLAMPKFKAVQKLVDKLNLVSRENLSGLMVIRAFGTQAHETKRFDAANQDLTQTNLAVNRLMVLMMPAMTLIMNGATLLIVWVGAGHIANATMQVGDMMAFMQYAMQIIMAFLMLSFMFIMVPRAAVSAGRIAEVLETKLSINDPENAKPFEASKQGIVEFKNVSFRYPGAEQDALTDISFTAKPGETTALIGSTGAGKSTIANLILRFYDVTAGQILVDGVDVREVTQDALRSKIGFVPQKGILLTGTIESNLKYGKRDASHAEIEKAADVAQAKDFIEAKPEKFESSIAQGGSNVSGGQKQRLSIARALAKNPEILIFDDSFSALDFKTDATLRKALKAHTAQATQIVVAQRVGTIRHAQQILVLDEGHIVGRGTHEELLKNCPEYYEIASSQLSKEELA